MLQKLRNNYCLCSFLNKEPLNSVNKFMKNNKQYWGNQYEKMPNLLFTTEQINEIDYKIML